MAEIFVLVSSEEEIKKNFPFLREQKDLQYINLGVFEESVKNDPQIRSWTRTAGLKSPFEAISNFHKVLNAVSEYMVLEIWIEEKVVGKLNQKTQGVITGPFEQLYKACLSTGVVIKVFQNSGLEYYDFSSEKIFA